MALTIGIDYSSNAWKTCLMENGRILELRSFPDAPSALKYLKQTCAVYPEPIITIASDTGTLFAPLHTLNEQNMQNAATAKQGEHQQPKEAAGFLIALGSANLNSYSLPSIRHLPSIPSHRRQTRLDMGSSEKLCAVTTLLYRMRRQEAIWPEMRFLYVDVSQNSRSIVVIEDGRIVNGIGETAGTQPDVGLEDYLQAEEISANFREALINQAYWEGLTQDLAGLMAIHHLEDLVVTGPRKQAVIERMADRYQFYEFPHAEYEQEGFESAIGAALIAEGLYHPGLAAEVIERLQLPQASNRLRNRLLLSSMKSKK